MFSKLRKLVWEKLSKYNKTQSGQKPAVDVHSSPAARRQCSPAEEERNVRVVDLLAGPQQNSACSATTKKLNSLPMERQPLVIVKAKEEKTVGQMNAVNDSVSKGNLLTAVKSNSLEVSTIQKSDNYNEGSRTLVHEPCNHVERSTRTLERRRRSREETAAFEEQITPSLPTKDVHVSATPIILDEGLPALMLDFNPWRGSSSPSVSIFGADQHSTHDSSFPRLSAVCPTLISQMQGAQRLLSRSNIAAGSVYYTEAYEESLYGSGGFRRTDAEDIVRVNLLESSETEDQSKSAHTVIRTLDNNSEKAAWLNEACFAEHPAIYGHDMLPAANTKCSSSINTSEDTVFIEAEFARFDGCHYEPLHEAQESLGPSHLLVNDGEPSRETLYEYLDTFRQAYNTVSEQRDAAIAMNEQVMIDNSALPEANQQQAHMLEHNNPLLIAQEITALEHNVSIRKMAHKIKVLNGKLESLHYQEGIARIQSSEMERIQMTMASLRSNLDVFSAVDTYMATNGIRHGDLSGGFMDWNE